MGHALDGVRYGAMAVETADRSRDEATRAMARAAHCYPLFLTGALEEGLAEADGLIELTRDDPMLGGGLGAESPYVWAISFRTLPLSSIGRFPEALAAATEGEELARRLELSETLGWTHSFRLGYEHWSGGRDGELALAYGRGSLEIAESIGSSFSLIVALSWLGEAHRIAGEPERALAPLDQALELILSSGSGLDFEVYARWLRAHALTDVGDPERAIEEGSLAGELARRRGVRVHEPGALIATARGHLARGSADDLAAAEGLIDDAAANAAAIGARAYELQVHDCRAALARARGEASAARDALDAGIATARELGASGWEERFGESLGSITA